MDIREILDYLPHRYPFLLLDRVLEFEQDHRLLAQKNVTYNEQFFQGHFPKFPVMPAVLILEAMAQATGLLALHSMDTPPSDRSVYYFVGIDKARFRKPVTPGDQLMVEVVRKKIAGKVWQVAAVARVDDAVVADANIMGALRELES